MSLEPCTSCRRHIRARDAKCPFCKSARTSVARKAATLAIVVTGVALGGCQSGTPQASAPDAAPTAETSDSSTEVDIPSQPVAVDPSADGVATDPVPPKPNNPFAIDAPGAPSEPSANPDAPGAIEAPPFDRPMVARYGVAPRPIAPMPAPSGSTWTAPSPPTK